MARYADAPDVEIPEWAANTKTLHAWVEYRPTRGAFSGRRIGYKSLCGVTTRYEFEWSLDVTLPDALRTAYHFNGRPVCETCRDAVERSST